MAGEKNGGHRSCRREAGGVHLQSGSREAGPGPIAVDVAASGVGSDAPAAGTASAVAAKVLIKRPGVRVET